MNGTDLKISQIALGTIMLGDTIKWPEAEKIIDYSRDMGINFIDTADSYNAGESENLIGRALSGRRSKIVVATKVGYPKAGGIASVNLSRGYILSAVEESLRRLRTDWIDILYLHAPDYGTQIEETLEAADRLKRQGSVRYIGVSNYAAWQIMELLWKSGLHGFSPPSVTQNIYNLLSRGIESELIPCARSNKLGLTIYNPLAGGLLTGKYSGGVATYGRFSWSKMYRDKYWNDENLSAAERLCAVAAKGSMNLLELSCRWCISQTCVDSVLFGVSCLEQLRQNLEYAEHGPLLPEFIRMCNEVWTDLQRPRPQYMR